MGKKKIVVFLTMLCMGIGLLTAPQRAYATEVPGTSTETDNSTETEEVVYTQVQVSKDKTYTKSLKDEAPVLSLGESELGFNSKGKVKITWQNFYQSQNGKQLTYELQMAGNAKFKNGKKFTTMNTYVNIARSKFGKNGGTMYFRVRFYEKFNGKKVYSAWSEVRNYNFVKINKKNFPGMHELLKKGGRYYDWKKSCYYTQVYDTNKDGWLDPKEIFEILQIANSKEYTSDHKPLPMIEVSSLQGVHYFTNLSSISLEQYSGTKADFSQNQKMNHISIRGITSKSIQVISPTATYVDIEPTYSNTSFEKADLSKCKNAQTVYAYVAKETKILKLPDDKKTLRVLSISDYSATAPLDLNGYINLDQIFLYECGMTKLNVNKCKNLQYLYFYYCNNIQGLDIRANKNLRAVDAYKCDKLSKSTIVASANTQVTQDQGKWFMDTAEYKKNDEKLYSIGGRLNIKDQMPYLQEVKMTSKGKVKLSWGAKISYMQDAKVSYEIQIADNPQFKKAKKFTSKKTSLTVNKNKLGKNGGIYYFRVRLCDSSVGRKNYTGWSETGIYTCVKLNKKNFPGLYNLLKNGSYQYNSDGKLEEIVYDKNKDGWLDHEEIMQITNIISVNGVAVSSLKGIEYLNIQTVELDNYTGNVVETKTGIYSIRLKLSGTKGNIEVITPEVKEIYIILNNGMKKISEVDFAQCNKAVSIDVSANRNVERLELPENTFYLKSLGLSGFELKNQDFSAYKNLKNIEVQ